MLYSDLSTTTTTQDLDILTVSFQPYTTTTTPSISSDASTTTTQDSDISRELGKMAKFNVANKKFGGG